MKLEPAIIWKLVTCQRITSQKYTWPRWVNTWARYTVKWYWSADTLFWQLSIDHNIVVQYVCTGAHQMDPPSPLTSWVNPFPSRFINRTACFPRKVSYFSRMSRMSPWRKWSWMKSNSEARPSTAFLFTIRQFLWFYSRWDLGIMK